MWRSVLLREFPDHNIRSLHGLPGSLSPSSLPLSPSEGTVLIAPGRSLHYVLDTPLVDVIGVSCQLQFRPRPHRELVGADPSPRGRVRSEPRTADQLPGLGPGPAAPSLARHRAAAEPQHALRGTEIRLAHQRQDLPSGGRATRRLPRCAESRLPAHHRGRGLRLPRVDPHRARPALSAGRILRPRPQPPRALGTAARDGQRADPDADRVRPGFLERASRTR